MRKRYPSDLTDAQWQALQPLLPPAKPGGRPRQVDAFAANLQRAPILEGLLVRRTGGVVVAQQQAPRLLMPDARDVLVEQR